MDEEEILYTSYEDVVGAFLAKIDDYKMLNYSDDEVIEDAIGYMIRSCADFEEFCDEKIVFNQETMMFESKLSNRQIDIIALGMVVEWLKPIVYKADAMHNVMNLKDATFFSPAKVMEQKNLTYANARKEYIRACYNYTYFRGDLEDLHI